MTRWTIGLGLLAVAMLVGSLALGRARKAGAADKEATVASKDLPEDPFPRKIKAPPLEGGIQWLNTDHPVTLADLKGKVVVLDFWTFCCINCMHVLPDLKKLEQQYPNELVVIGVHSAKFAGEKDSGNIREAILRYDIHHPVVNDANFAIWQAYQVHSWPTLYLIDPEGNVVGGVSGEGNYDVLNAAIKSLIAYHKAKGTLDPKPLRFALEKSRVKDSPLLFPGKILADGPSGRLFISDSNHNRVVIASLDGKLLDIAGSGAQGHEDGSFEKATFHHPQGMALDGQTLYLADTESHMIRKLDLKARSVTALAGTGEQAAERNVEGKGRAIALNSPWDLVQVGRKLYIAMAGPHQIWALDLDSNHIMPYAGSGREDIIDGPLHRAAFAQPSGITTDDTSLFTADSETSSIRQVPLDTGGEVKTIVGQGLFEFDDIDGQGDAVRLQHPLGITNHDGLLYITDTYNNKIKTLDPKTRACRTFLGKWQGGSSDAPLHLNEPGGLSIAGKKLYVADTNNHAIRVVDLSDRKVETLTIHKLNPPAVSELAKTPITH